MNTLNLLILSAIFATPPVAYHSTHSLTVGDGDTVVCDVVLTKDIALTRQSIRAANYDAWENKQNRQSEPFKSFTDAQWAAEIVKGKKAHAELTALLASGDLYVVITGREVYGRLLAKWYVYRKDSDELVDVAKVMRERGHVRR